jgi:membrane-bound metal-dependent hydrolase YbcI (DUF457 family)
MPFTPLHMGPALSIKAMFPQHFSLRTFGVVQITIDIEPLIRIINQDNLLHGLTHTYLGATIVGLVSAIIVQHILLISQRFSSINKFYLFKTISWKVNLVSALSGVYSHVFLDSLMHPDIQPWYPFSLENPILSWISIGWLHIFCLGLGVSGGFALILMWAWKKIAIEI